jgi:hypothetical protein
MSIAANVPGISSSSVGEPNRLSGLLLVPMNQCLKLREERHLCGRGLFGTMNRLRKLRRSAMSIVACANEL